MYVATNCGVPSFLFFPSPTKIPFGLRLVILNSPKKLPVAPLKRNRLAVRNLFTLYVFRLGGHDAKGTPEEFVSYCGTTQS